ncbi:hypothetical protein, partial [Persephonella sp.]|uniref:hypothetical protein n=1 Tax=Persephonella sp. TaxID=2060922 RepID=UPI0025EEA527
GSFIGFILLEIFFGNNENIYVLVPIIPFMTPTSFFLFLSVGVHLLSELIHPTTIIFKYFAN